MVKKVMNTPCTVVLSDGMRQNRCVIDENKRSVHRKHVHSTELQVSGGVSNISPHLWKMTSLTALFMSRNELRSVPSDLSKLINLTILDLSFNSLQSLPPEMGNMINLCHLFLNNNQLQVLPYELGKLRHLQTFQLEGNPLTAQLMHIYCQQDGQKKLLEFLLDNLSVKTRTPPTRQWIMTTYMDPEIPAAPFTLLSYNVLCEAYTTTELYSYCPKWALKWQYRKEAILREIREYEADIILLQEVETEQFWTLFEPELKTVGYIGIFSPKTRAYTVNEDASKHVDGCAIFWKQDKFERDRMYQIGFSQLAMQNACGSSDMLNRVVPKDNIALCVVLRIKTGIYSQCSESAGLRSQQERFDKEDVNNWDSLHPAIAENQSGEPFDDFIMDSEVDTPTEQSTIGCHNTGLPCTEDSTNQSEALPPESIGAFSQLPSSCFWCTPSSDSSSRVFECFSPGIYEQRSSHQMADEEIVGMWREMMAECENFVGRPLIVCTTHIHWNPKNCDVKLVQSMLLAQEIGKILNETSERYHITNAQTPLILCGDFNSLPDSGVYEFFSKGAVAKDHPDLKQFHDSACLTHVNASNESNDDKFYASGLHLKSAFDLTDICDIQFTNFTEKFSGVIDHMFFTPQSLLRLGLLGPLDGSWIRDNNICGFPHPHIPSDHIPIMAQFSLISTRYRRLQRPGGCELVPWRVYSASHE